MTEPANPAAPNNPPALHPEARMLLELFSANVSNSMLSMEQRLSGQINQARAEAREDSKELREEQRKQSEAINAQAVQLATINTRLENGEKRFDGLEQRVEKVEEDVKAKPDTQRVETVEKRVEVLESDSKHTGKGLAYLAGAAAGGGTIGAILTRAIGG
jgi:predicted  nucleic acid-binding Zn-ribbon protein